MSRDHEANVRRRGRTMHDFYAREDGSTETTIQDGHGPPQRECDVDLLQKLDTTQRRIMQVFFEAERSILVLGTAGKSTLLCSSAD